MNGEIKIKTQPNKSFTGIIKLVYKEEVSREEAFSTTQILCDKLDGWLMDIRPALKRGEKVSIQIDFLDYKVPKEFV